MLRLHRRCPVCVLRTSLDVIRQCRPKRSRARGPIAHRGRSISLLIVTGARASAQAKANCDRGLPTMFAPGSSGKSMNGTASNLFDILAKEWEDLASKREFAKLIELLLQVRSCLANSQIVRDRSRLPCSHSITQSRWWYSMEDRLEPLPLRTQLVPFAEGSLQKCVLVPALARLSATMREYLHRGVQRW
jgi:hypothetical protein